MLNRKCTQRLSCRKIIKKKSKINYTGLEMKTRYQVDGEVIGPTPAYVTTLASKLTVMVPK